MNIRSVAFAIYSLFFITGWYSNLSAQTLLQPSKLSESERAIMKSGIALADEGKYDEALVQYQSVLKQDSSSVDAIYESAYTYYSIGDTARARAFLVRGLRYDSKYRGQFFDVLGSVEDDEGYPEKAVGDYQMSIKYDSTYQLSYFNLGTTLIRMGNNDAALPVLEKSVTLNPNHPTSHLRLAYLYQQKKQIVPALMAYTRAFVLARDSARAAQASRGLFYILDSSASNHMEIGADNKSTTEITLSSPDASEGNFMMAELGLKMILPGMDQLTTDPKIKMAPLDVQVMKLSKLYEVIADCDSAAGPHPEGFAMNHYGTYFRDMVKAGHTKALSYYVSLFTYPEESNAWAKDHMDDVKAFFKWNSEYYADK